MRGVVWKRRVFPTLVGLALAVAGAVANGRPRPTPPVFESELIFPPHNLHNHGSCVVEMPGGGLFVCWYRGSGERTADDVAVMAARLPRGATRWQKPFVLADTPGFPDTNPCLVVDPQRRLWLFHSTVLNNRWESSLLKYRVSDHYENPSRPILWKDAGVIPLKPGPEFLQAVEREMARLWEPYRLGGKPEDAVKLDEYLAERRKMAGDKLATRLGWMGRVHPLFFQHGTGHRFIVPLYSDGFDFSLFALSDDGGMTWRTSAPVVGPGNVQPSVVLRKNGTLVAYFRDNGPPPQRVMQSESTDGGETWAAPRDSVLHDPGAGVEAVALRSGRWLLVNNDTENGRHSLAVSVSEDEGRTWIYKKYLEHDTPGPDAGSYSYPSLMQARDGAIHVTYSYRPNRERATKEGQGECVKHVRFAETWLTAQEGRVPL